MSTWNVRNKANQHRSMALLHGLGHGQDLHIMSLLKGVFLSCGFLPSANSLPFDVLLYILRTHGSPS